MCKIQCFIESRMVDGGGHMTTSAAIVSLSSSVYAWLESNCEWTLNSARVDRCHFSWQAIIPVPVFLVHFILARSLTTSREKSVSLISDIYLALIAAGEHMHSIEMQVSIRRVDNSSASGNSGIVFINCFCCHCHCLSPTLSELLLFCLALTHSYPSSSPQFWLEGHIWGWLLLPILWNIPCVENMSVFFPSCIKMKNMFEVKEGISATLISEWSWLASFTSNQRQSYGLIKDVGLPVMTVKSWWQRV